MKLTKREIAQTIALVWHEQPKYEWPRPPRRAIRELTARYYELSCWSRPLAHSEQGIVAVHNSKTAALFADRVWSLDKSSCDPDLSFGWETYIDVYNRAWRDLKAMGAAGSIDVREAYDLLGERARLCARAVHPGGEVRDAPALVALGRDATCKECAACDECVIALAMYESEAIARAYREDVGMRVSPAYATSAEMEPTYARGDQSAVVAIASNLGVVEEGLLTWEQVREFRRDREARAAYRAFIHWLDASMLGKPTSYVTDEIALRLARYRWALEKHGLETTIGMLQQAINPGALVGGAAIGAAMHVILNQPLWSLLAGGGLIVAGATLSAAKVLVARKDLQFANLEIAYVHEISRRAK